VDKGKKKEELIVLLCTINVRITPKQTKGDPAFTADMRCLTPILQDKDVTGKHCRSVAETHINTLKSSVRINFGIIRPKTLTLCKLVNVITLWFSIRELPVRILARTSTVVI
jgi:hypothetical protein